jgi:multiple sugar transport system substrate-binding protein
MSALRKLLVIAVLAGLVAACAGSPSESPGGPGTNGGQAPKLTGAADGAGNVTVAVPSSDPGDINLRQRMAKEFTAKNPQIKVKLLVIPDTNYDQKVITMIAGGKPPDVFGSGDVQIPNIVQKRYALDLKPLMEAESYDTSDFYPQVIQGLTFGGKVVGLSDNWDTQVMYYNKTLFDKAGVEYPNESWTWDQFKETAGKLTSGEGTNKVFGAVYNPWFAPVYDQIWSYGGEVFSQDGKTCQLASPESVAAHEWIVDLFDKGYSPSPAQIDQLGQDQLQLFLAGRAAMSIGGGRWDAFSLKDVKRFDWAVAPLPTGPAGRANFFHLAMFAVAANSKNQTGAWKFLQYMLSPEGMKLASQNTQGIPARQSLAKDPAFTSNELVVKHDAYQPFLTSLPTVHTAPYISNFSEIQDRIDPVWDSIWTKKKPAGEALSALCKDLDGRLAKAGAP